MNNNLNAVFFLSIMLGVFLILTTFEDTNSREKPAADPDSDDKLKLEPLPEAEEVEVEPIWIRTPPLRVVDAAKLGRVLADIDSRMHDGHRYKDNDKITWGHETTHGINARLRNENFRRPEIGDRSTGLYCLNERGLVMKNPAIKLSQVATTIPKSLQGNVYRLYLVQQQVYFEDRPLYVFDEWVAYANGGMVRQDLKIQPRDETVQYMMEFNIYSIAVAMAAEKHGVKVDPNFKPFLMWHLKRAMKIRELNRGIGDISASDAWWEKVKTERNAEDLRKFCRTYFGKRWSKEVLEI